MVWWVVLLLPSTSARGSSLQTTNPSHQQGVPQPTHPLPPPPKKQTIAGLSPCEPFRTNSACELPLNCEGWSVCLSKKPVSFHRSRLPACPLRTSSQFNKTHFKSARTRLKKNHKQGHVGVSRPSPRSQKTIGCFLFWFPLKTHPKRRLPF